MHLVRRLFRTPLHPGASQVLAIACLSALIACLTALTLAQA
jgi:hypothetical protein